MHTHDDVIRYFTYQLPQPETETPAKAVLAATHTVEVWINHYNDGTHLTVKRGDMAIAHPALDHVIREAALALFNTLPKTPDRTAALRALWLVRGLGHAWLEAHEKARELSAMCEAIDGEADPQAKVTALDECIPARSIRNNLYGAIMVRLTEVNIQAVGAIVLASPPPRFT